MPSLELVEQQEEPVVRPQPPPRAHPTDDQHPQAGLPKDSRPPLQKKDANSTAAPPRAKRAPDPALAAGLTAHISTDIRAMISSLSPEERAALLSAPAPSGADDSEGSISKTARRESATDVKDTAASGAEAMDTGDQLVAT